jgi:hypothetical protein
MGEACSAHGTNEKCVQNISRKTSGEDGGVDGKLILKWILGFRFWNGFLWLRTETSGELLWVR